MPALIYPSVFARVSVQQIAASDQEYADMQRQFDSAERVSVHLFSELNTVEHSNKLTFSVPDLSVLVAPEEAS